MSDPKVTPPAESAAAGAGASTVPSSNGTGVNTSATAPKKPVVDNPAFRMMGLPRLRLPSRNWMIFLSLSGFIASAIAYDKYQTRLTKQKWCDVVRHLADEPLDTKNMPRKLTIYLSAPPGDGLRSAREHFHQYIKPVLVAGAMDWDVIEGRKEGDVRHKTAEKTRKKRRRRGEGAAMDEEEAAKEYAVETVRDKTGTGAYPGVGGDLVVGRHTWKEYVKGLHEGWLGPVDDPHAVEIPKSEEPDEAKHTPGQASVSDAALNGAAEVIAANTSTSTPDTTTESGSNSPTTPELPPVEETPKEEEKPKPRQPPPYILPAAYSTATLSPSIPEILGPSVVIPQPHILGIRNTPIRIYRFLTRRRLADTIGRDVAAAVLASAHRSYSVVPADADTASATDSGPSSSTTVPEQTQVLFHEEREWWKTVRKPRLEHEESVWIDDMVLDERIAGRMRKFEISGNDEDRAKRFAAGTEIIKKAEEES
ncbi:mitochondrial import inner membrane translocase subunit tim54 [Elasticomyces elasticus]|nr:mitochondrial import inner membrane translocase subunit tim54 [Elasticomyces elasticus]KAK3632842.1 mitochondrial import inner membrane translocase subunit tim54 [Elasticomyces elasticus]KAK4912157.1 mitochondrial import inner membrane translocase subunit tim54 [Elasticomyces elasticus]KAK5738625.1 mitochondrial import inner membrane translocase subunit tim54 [Elasticomyces elasticus]